MNFDRKYLVWALGYLIVGMGLGLYMAASKNHAQLVTHAHILMVGFAVSFIYGIIHRLWLKQPGKTLATIQFALHQAAAFAMCTGLLLLYGGVLPESTLTPLLGAGSLGVWLAALLMIWLVRQSGRTTSAALR
ncbi:TonB-dependent receptor [Rhodanobacter sp. Si-c]|uniref:TonB-dependent receptor n=1 Tax=Rhodanobacter lycopersici TaxID=3162487 RepID=A0ABV3Q9H7_9GAMM